MLLGRGASHAHAYWSVETPLLILLPLKEVAKVEAVPVTSQLAPL
jgi:hypothetical protein